MPFRPLSVYAGAGGQGTRISFARHWSFNTNDGLKVMENNKRTMHNLNDRLSSYIQNVHALGSMNAELEKKIKERSLSHALVSKDHTHFLSTIKQLQDQIENVAKSTSNTVLMIDNAKLAVEDFRVMYENEAALRLKAETDVNHIRNIQNEMAQHQSNLEMKYERLKEDRVILEKNFEEALKCDQTGVQLNVSVDTNSSTDLGKTLQKIREQYETVVAKNCQELEIWYQNKNCPIEQEVVTQSQELQFSRIELRELNSTYQMMQIELQTIHNMKTLCEARVSDSIARYSEELANLQRTIFNLEFKLQQINVDITEKKQKYDSLEDEIQKYRLLLKEKNSNHQIIYKTVEETVVDKVVVEISKTVSID